MVALAGGVGGALNGWQINFFRSDLNTLDPAIEQVQDPNKKAAVREAIAKPKTEKWGSVLFNVASGALAAAVSWSAYGPYALENVFGGAASKAPAYGLTLTALATAVVIGIGGSRWLTNERDKTLLKQAADDAAVTADSETKRKLMQRGDPKQQALIASMDL
jgi:hypothetical protein